MVTTFTPGAEVQRFFQSYAESENNWTSFLVVNLFSIVIYVSLGSLLFVFRPLACVTH
jgi:hypothetical protein